MNLEQLYTTFLKSAGVCTDTRKLEPNQIFFALSGPNFNGNKFAAAALEQGALAVVIDQAKYKHPVEGTYFLVDDCLIALQELATHHRRALGLPILSLTGSNGKTTTKELIAAILSQKFNLKATRGNYNNHIGVPLTLLSFTSENDFGIVEMGANHQGEIAELATIAEPDFGFITNFGKAHLEGFGGIEGVIKGKSELYRNLASRNKTVFVNQDDPKQMELTEAMDRVLIGAQMTGNKLELVATNPRVVFALNDTEIQSHLIGEHNAKNIRAAIGIGLHFGLSEEQIKTGVESYNPENNRSQWVSKPRNKILLDAYNANPSSMEATLKSFKTLGSQAPKTVILGDMFELGETAAAEHQAIADLANSLNFDRVFLVGANFYAVDAHDGQIKCSEYEDLVVALQQKDVEGHLLLIKGSRGMALERILDIL
ncbi:UDP-N-acetylmuramoyl-tripeptide--D-alanyl-D-alanine ligase [Gilvibacter sediminis]|uniref:UDP-N-acetylmuramoyl-tripeptide--D-alanyl-D- alanine ligase n=1 Tax=Gilvibacter sediminis TaxID=379071 RepID=UPI002350C932|nr:UDP-N-acetylmuramoyl-tripeptide--D-alanyl-D-alanine ligase [Gilvibacter sediminis]MDC7997568.1 UDP-N-acetylmuramoyl-tripeptide--D-alanyl-D-alanine ligase [Gilvibacter sediminis]